MERDVVWRRRRLGFYRCLGRQRSTNPDRRSTFCHWVAYLEVQLKEQTSLRFTSST